MSRNHQESTNDADREQEYPGLFQTLDVARRARQAQAAINAIINHKVNETPVTCHYCNRPASETAPADWDDEHAWDRQYDSADEWVQEQDATFNPVLNQFCCDRCYIKIGMPSSPTGWKAGFPSDGERR